MKNRLSLWIRVLLAFPLMFSCGGGAMVRAPGPDSDSIEIGTIAFDSTIDGDYGIDLMDSDGSNSRNISNRACPDCSSAWSPDGARIVFSSVRDGNREIYMRDADGSNQTLLTNHPAWDYQPSWSLLEARLRSLPIGRVDSRSMSWMRMEGIGKGISSKSRIHSSPAWKPRENPE